MIWLALFGVAVIFAGQVICVLSVRSTCLTALTMLREYLASELRDEISHLRQQIQAKDEQILGIHHPSTQAVLSSQKAPARPYETGWEAAASRPRNPMRYDVSVPEAPDA